MDDRSVNPIARMEQLGKNYRRVGSDDESERGPALGRLRPLRWGRRSASEAGDKRKRSGGLLKRRSHSSKPTEISIPQQRSVSSLHAISPRARPMSRGVSLSGALAQSPPLAQPGVRSTPIAGATVRPRTPTSRSPTRHGMERSVMTNPSYQPAPMTPSRPREQPSYVGRPSPVTRPSPTTSSRPSPITRPSPSLAERLESQRFGQRDSARTFHSGDYSAQTGDYSAQTGDYSAQTGDLTATTTDSTYQSTTSHSYTNHSVMSPRDYSRAISPQPDALTPTGSSQRMSLTEMMREHEEALAARLEGAEDKKDPKEFDDDNDGITQNTNETEEDRMMRLAMEMSLRTFEEQHGVVPNEPPESSTPSSTPNSFYGQSSNRGTRNNGSSAANSRNTNGFRSGEISEQLQAARQHLSRAEAEEIERALREAGEVESIGAPRGQSNSIGSRRHSSHLPPSSRPRSANAAPSHHSTPMLDTPALSTEEFEAIEKAIREAEAQENERSFSLALQLQSEETDLVAPNRQSRQNQGNVRTMSWQDARQTQLVGAHHSSSPPRRHSMEYESIPNRRHGHGNAQRAGNNRSHEQTGFRMNSNSQPEGAWQRRDRQTVIGPNAEVRTKHDLGLQAEAIAESLGLDMEEDIAPVGGKAYNSFKQSMQKQKKKGVAAHGTGRASSDTDRTSGGAMDPRVRTYITRAINTGLIDKCNGVVKEGKEAIVYHANKGTKSQGFDVAVKVFKRITEFRGRADYVDGDSRYKGRQFRNSDSREQLEIWAEKEYRNLIRAQRARVPAPSPLQQRENLLFMRFMGEEGWPAPQLKELSLKKGSKKWTQLYSQIMVAVRRLYVNARLIHGDLSEYNVLVCPAAIVEHKDDSETAKAKGSLQAVLIDFGQAIDVHHPSANELLERDLGRIRTFFQKKGIKTLGTAMSMEFVTSPDPDDEEEGGENDDEEEEEGEEGDQRLLMDEDDLDYEEEKVEEGEEVYQRPRVNDQAQRAHFSASLNSFGSFGSNDHSANDTMEPTTGESTSDKALPCAVSSSSSDGQSSVRKTRRVMGGMINGETEFDEVTETVGRHGLFPDSSIKSDDFSLGSRDTDSQGDWETEWDEEVKFGGR